MMNGFLRRSPLRVALTGGLVFASLYAYPLCAENRQVANPSVNDVQWTTLGSSENDSLPIGNGDLAANVWTEQNGDLVLLVAKSDAWSELGKLDKLARIRIHLDQNPFTNASDFRQALHIENGSIQITSGANHLTVWVDANRPVIHVIGDLASDADCRQSGTVPDEDPQL